MAQIKYTDIEGLKYILQKFLEKTNAKYIDENGLDKLKYTNVNMSTVTNAKQGLDTITLNVVGLVTKTDELEVLTQDMNDSTNGILAQAKAYTNNQISLQTHLSLKIVDTLPTENISTTTIYLINANQGQGNVYKEYIYIENAWELIGTTETDLSNYYSKAETDTKLGLKVDKIEGKGLSSNDFTSSHKQKLEEITTATNAELDTIINDIFTS